MASASFTAEERELLKPPPRSRLETAAIAARRLATDAEWRHHLPLADDGTLHIIIAGPHDFVSEVFTRVDELGMPATVCIPFGDTIFPLVVERGRSKDKQECAPDSEIGMLVELLIRTKGPVTVLLTEPVQLAFAYA